MDMENEKASTKSSQETDSSTQQPTSSTDNSATPSTQAAEDALSGIDPLSDAGSNMVPPGLKDLLLSFTVSVLRTKPRDLLEHASNYFTELRDAAVSKVRLETVILHHFW